HAIFGNVVGCYHVKSAGRRCLFKTVLLCIGGKLRGERLLCGANALLLEHRYNLGLYLGERTEMRRLLLLHLQDVVTELRLDDVRGLTRIQSKGDLVTLRHRASAVEPSQFSTSGLAARVVGVLAGKIGEVCTTLDLLQQI